ncbi:MAG TPA: hypothetical protein V6D17_14020 [Candidatus Obscuribacterales bacterium]
MITTNDRILFYAFATKLGISSFVAELIETIVRRVAKDEETVRIAAARIVAAIPEVTEGLDKALAHALVEDKSYGYATHISSERGKAFLEVFRAGLRHFSCLDPRWDRVGRRAQELANALDSEGAMEVPVHVECLALYGLSALAKCLTGGGEGSAVATYFVSPIVGRAQRMLSTGEAYQALIDLIVSVFEGQEREALAGA